jgi:hypothetical protein
MPRQEHDTDVDNFVDVSYSTVQYWTRASRWTTPIHAREGAQVLEYSSMCKYPCAAGLDGTTR